MASRYFPVFLIAALTLVPRTTMTQDCNSFCDAAGLYHTSFPCIGAKFCCGSVRYRYCCALPADAINPIDNTSTDTCSSLGWWTYRWRMLFGIGFTVVGLAVLLTLCRFCCIRYKQRQTTIQPNHVITPGHNGHRLRSSRSLYQHSARMANPTDPPPYSAVHEKPPAYTSVYPPTAGSSASPLAEVPSPPPAYSGL